MMNSDHVLEALYRSSLPEVFFFFYPVEICWIYLSIYIRYHLKNDKKWSCIGGFIQKQPPRGVPKMYWKYAANLYNKFIGEQLCSSVISIKLQTNFIKITLRHGCFSVNLLHIFRTLFYRNTSGGPLLLIRLAHESESVRDICVR